MPIVSNALIEIQNRGLNKIRCAITGAPYATLESDEILQSLRSDVENDPSLTQERLVDNWELKALTFNSQVLPSLRGVNTKALVPMLNSGAKGSVKILTYFLTRLLYPQIGAEPKSSEFLKERMLFAIHMYDSALEWDSMKTSSYVQQLSVIDSYCSMPYWHTLWAFESAFSKFGLAKSPKIVQETFADPLRITEDMTRIDAVVTYLYELMLHVAERDGVAGKSGNKLAQEIMFMSAAALPKIVIPHFQKTLSDADKLRLENKRRVDSKTELRVAHSAIHGKKFAPIHGKQTMHNAEENAVWQMAKEMQKSLAKKSESQPKPKQSKQTKPLSKLDRQFEDAFKSLNIKF
jgi:hypothetical protein